jgi:uncharacterized protein YbbK (DUF523 family)
MNRKEPGFVLVSACLLGIECNYQGKASGAWVKGLKSFFNKARQAGLVLLPVCPEQLGGLPTPRIPSELQPGPENAAKLVCVLAKDGKDVSANFIKGARQALKIAQLYGCNSAVLKSKSPSCGSERVYDGTFSGRLVAGKGITAALLARHGMLIVDEKRCLHESEAVIADLLN